MRKACALLLTFLIAGMASTSIAAGDSNVILHDADSESEKVANKLADTVDVAWDQVRLIDAVEDLRRRTGVNVFVNWAALEAAGIKQDNQVTLQSKQMPGGTALRLLARSMGEGSVGAAVIDGVVQISTYRDLAASHVVRVYDIRAALVGHSTFKEAPEFALDTALG